ncbi:MAG: Rrf2 family transcriptional regulator [Ignavibacteria bacterium]|jgi:Rrf2 family nitric oxide-sensitive transcriptional repressor|nr:Rrf2 family transcriptional regulator [Ignavibacteria bacterium]MCU7502925.1 Rrf2 family transcriptional regulator [Ignavibacteria bacterium]MCU7515581.1 Rrf2 family transcriptional regulator [Ignavibacteria bacterium]
MQSYLTRECDYAIRITAFLAGLKSQKQLPVSEIAKRIHVTKSYAARIIHVLKNGGIVLTTQGLYGGVCLARDAGEISFYDVMQAMNFKATLNECLCNKDVCTFPKVCKVHAFFALQEKNLLDELKKAKISDYAFDEVTIDKINSTK